MRHVFLIAMIVVAMIGMIIPSAYAEEIPSWIKNNAGWWADGTTDDETFVLGIQFLIEEKIISLSPTTIDEIKKDSKKKIFLLPKEGKFTIYIHEKFPNYNVLNSLYVGIITPDGSTVGIFSETANMDGVFTSYFDLYPSHDEGEYKIIGKSGNSESILNSFFVKKQSTSDIPSWIKNNAGWWANDVISQSDFMVGIQYLLEEQIIQINPEILGATMPQICTQDMSGYCCAVVETPRHLMMCSDEITIETIQEQDELFILKLDNIHPRNSAENNWDSFKILEDYQSPQTAKDSLRMHYEKDESLFQFYLYQFPTISDAEMYYEEWVDYHEILYFENDFTPWEVTVTPSNVNQKCHDDRVGSPNFNPVGMRFDYGSAIVCISNNIIIHSIMQTDNVDTLVWHISSTEQVFSKINTIMNYDTIETSIDMIDPIISVSSSDVTIEGESTSFDEGFSGLYCKQDGIFVEMTGKYTNGVESYSSIYFKLGVLDNQDRIVATGLGSISNVAPYQTKMFSAMAEWSGDFKECVIEVDTAFR
ncbi:MAG: hypothetical protein HOD60_07600 [Candidatus Nitrosopelagicus sp.]|nr:hypothetical protein [Candidatus Nitrosopelagicus sp.]